MFEKEFVKYEGHKIFFYEIFFLRSTVNPLGLSPVPGAGPKKFGPGPGTSTGTTLEFFDKQNQFSHLDPNKIFIKDSSKISIKI